MAAKRSLRLQEPPASPAPGVPGSCSRGLAEKSARQRRPWGGAPPLRGLGTPGTQCGGGGGRLAALDRPLLAHAPWEPAAGDHGPQRRGQWVTGAWVPPVTPAPSLTGASMPALPGVSLVSPQRERSLSGSVHSGRISLPTKSLQTAYCTGPCVRCSSGSEAR